MQVFRGDTVAGVGNSDIAGSQYEVNSAVFRTVADGVIKQIADKDGKQGMVTG
nr:hypothetical protein [Snodgrassella alvi]